MRKWKSKVAIGAVIVAAMVGGGATAASAAVPAGGGSWEYGVNLRDNFSYYYHGTYYHRSTAYNNDVAKRAYGEAGQWSRAVIAAAVSGNQASWYHANGNRNI